ncbi:hypothetical protein [uncultured Clostridium sp.]|uniref:hypothetical protein n=1 Tax=uncultured Clostridium sp. TaxID=59620 RepID=UPI0026242351|nr:hypothetical protein [uncultured Clostridium sp.]
MIKIRLTFVDTEEGNVELNTALNKISNGFVVIQTSKIYKGRGNSKYSNIYLDVENKAPKGTK